jgi:alpha-D-ribose 1-methylphosphonate 5-triphosphate synthase subunit PhnI
MERVACFSSTVCFFSSRTDIVNAKGFVSDVVLFHIHFFQVRLALRGNGDLLT